MIGTVNDDVTVAVAAKELGFSEQYIRMMCDLGQFPGAYKPGIGDRAQWRIPRNEVLIRKQPIKDRLT